MDETERERESERRSRERQVVDAIKLAYAREVKKNGRGSPRAAELRELLTIAVHDDRRHRLHRLVEAAPDATDEQRREIALILSE